MVSRSRAFGFRASLFRLLAVAVPLALIASLAVMALPPDAKAATATATAPGPPTDVTAVAGNAQATVSWKAPASNGGSSITSYTVTSVPADQTATASGSATSVTVSSLTNGTSYRFYVTATNSSGTSAASASSGPVTPAAPAPPAAPVITGVLARDSAVELAWSVPDTGTSGLTGYVITVSSGGSRVTTVNEPASATDATVTGLTNGTQYVFTATATNSTGSSPPSLPSPAIAPQPASAPMSPADVRAFPQDGQIQVSWSAPADRGSAITGYTVTVTPGAKTAATGPATTVATVTGLTNGTAYTVSVTAANNAGTSSAAQAAPVTPAASIPPSAPGHLSASTTGKGIVSLQWTPPVTSGTSAVASYTVTASPGGAAVSSDTCGGTPVLCTATMKGLTSTTAYTFTAKASSSAGASPASAATGAVKPDLVVKRVPVVLSGASVATLRQGGGDGTLIFERPPAQVTGLKANQIVEIGRSAAFPDGYLGIVLTTGTQGGFFVVSTKRASLDDVYSTYQSAMDIPFVPASVKAAAPGVRLDRPMRGGKLLPASISAPGGVTLHLQGNSVVVEVQEDLLGGVSEQGGDSTPGLAPMAELDGTLTLTPIFRYTDQNGSLNLTVGGTARAEVDAKLGVQLSASETLPVGYILGAPIDVGEFGEVTPELTISLVLDTNGSVGVSYSASYTATATGTCKISKSSTSGDTCTASKSGSGTESHTALYGSMDIKTGVQFGGVLDLDFGAVVAGVTLTPAIELKVDTTANPWWEVNIDIGLGVYVKVAVDVTVYNNDALVDFPVTIDQASRGFSGLFISPPVQAVPPGGTFTFQTATATGPVTTSDWSMAGGPGSIDGGGTYTAPPSGVGTAVVQAAFNGMPPARAGVVLEGMTAPVLDSGTRGLVDALTVSWQPPPAHSVPPDNYEIVACPDVRTITTAPTCVNMTVPGAGTYAYLPDLAPGSRYTIFVTAEAGNTGTGASLALSTTFPTVTVLAPLPSQLAGKGFNGDIASSLTTGRPDQNGTAGSGGAVVSGDGEYVFFYTEARSNLAPASIFNLGNEAPFLVRENLITHVIDVASIQPGGAPIAALDPVGGGASAESGLLVTNYAGNAVGFTTITGEPMVHNFVTGVTWLVGNSSGALLPLMDGLSNNGTVVAYQLEGTNAVQVYRQTQGGAPQLIGKAQLFGGDVVSMSGDGNLIAYETPQSSTAALSIYLYDATTGTNADLFPANTANRDELGNPLLSNDGSHIALYADNFATCSATCPQGIVVKPLSGRTSTTVTPADILVKDPGNNDTLLSITNAGSTFVYSDVNRLMVYQGGASTAVPSLGTTFAQSAQIESSPTGSAVVYTLWCESPHTSSTGQDLVNYPGVFEWALG
jgi:fibronectin type 3 domain-containing protein